MIHFNKRSSFIIAAIVVISLVLFTSFQLLRPAVSDKDIDSQGLDILDIISRNIVSGGPPKDGIPPIDKPRYVSAEKVDFLEDSDIVFGVNYKGFIAAYPQKILVWHEIVNDEFGKKVSLTYCPLTGSVIGFKEFDSQSFGTSGKLVNSNLVMYDRATDSYWPQILGTAVTGHNKGRKLDEFPVVWTTWERWKNVFPQTKVLSKDTGFIRSYGNDPYGSYGKNGTYYQQGGPFFPVMKMNNIFQPKEIFIGIEDGTSALAVKKDTIRTEKVINAKLGNESIVIIYDQELDDALAFKGSDRRFSYQDGKVVDDSGSAWNIWGISDRNESLEFVNSFNVMWFAWYAFYPETKIYEGSI